MRTDYRQIGRLRERHAAANLEAAQIIAANPERYPGLLLLWARMVLANAGAPPADIECGPLFSGKAA